MTTAIVATDAMREKSVHDGQESEEEQIIPPPSSWFETSNLPTVQVEKSLKCCDKNSSDIDEGDNIVESEAVDESSLQPIPTHPSNYTPTQAIGNTHPSPSWKEISSQVLPAAARELLSSSVNRIFYTARLSYAKGRWHRKYSDIGHNAGGFNVSSADLELPDHFPNLPTFSDLPWIDRQLVSEWRTYLPETPEEAGEDEDFDFERARTLVPAISQRPVWQKTDVCHECHKPFGPTRLRHHCRLCGYSYCQTHSMKTHRLPHLGYDPDVPERVCNRCKGLLQDQNLAERVAWRLARCRDYSEGRLTPYFEVGLDSAEDVALRITKAALAMAKSIPLGAQATVAVETVDVLRKYGLHGIYGIMLRQEFMAAADLLRRALGINKSSWPLSVHELSAAIFYALAQHRAMRGLNPEREEVIHKFRSQSIPPALKYKNSWVQNSEKRKVESSNELAGEIDNYELSALEFQSESVIDRTDTYEPNLAFIEQTNASFDSKSKPQSPQKDDVTPSFLPVCDPVPDGVVSSLVFYAPIALNFIYATKEVDMQLLAAQQGWRLLYAFLNQDSEVENLTDRPASALFLHQEHKIACLSIRGTATINDVVTDIRQIPVPFPEQDPAQTNANDDDWTRIFSGQGIALCGMASAAVNLFREHIDSILHFLRKGYRIRVTGHSLGGGVATLIGILVLRHLERYPDLKQKAQDAGDNEDKASLKVYAYGTPSCIDAALADSVDSFVTTVVLHDDVFPRLTPTSCRGLLKHLLHIRETWVKTHIEEDLRAVGERARTAWAPKFRQSFTLSSSSRSIKKYCKKQMQKGKKKLFSVQKKIKGDQISEDGSNDEKKTPDGRLNTFSTNAESNKETSSGESVAFSVATVFEEAMQEEAMQEEAFAADTGEETAEPKFLLEFLGGVDTETQGIVIDGDEFFDTGESLIEGDLEASETLAELEDLNDCESHFQNEGLCASDSWSTDIPMTSPQNHMASSTKQGVDESCSDSDNTAVVLEETPLPRMFVPGKIIHIYSYRGIYKAAYVPRTFRELRRISLAGNMLTNHIAKNYYEGLLEVQSARSAPESPPRWTSFDEDDTCSCCASRFTWASTSNSEAQEARDKHNCRSCGGLVCDPCAKNRVPVPSIGINVPVRVCDRCYNDLGSVTSSSMSGSFMTSDEAEKVTVNASQDNNSKLETGYKIGKRPERKREKRSAVVDDLASQMRSSALTASCL